MSAPKVSYVKSKKCGKRRYRDRIAALLALASTTTNNKTRSAKDEKRVYHCHLCKGWHLTSQPQRPRPEPHS